MRQRTRLLMVCVVLIGCPDTPTQAPQLREAAASSGLDFVYQNAASGDYRVREIIGGGAALLDVDGDGDLDAYLVQGKAREGQAGGNVLYRNRLADDGVLRFERTPSGAVHQDFGMGVAVADVDADGDPDLLVTNDGPDRFYRNDGGRFVVPADNWGIDGGGWSTSASFCDYDRDGDVDVYVAGYLDVPAAAEPVCRQASGRQDYCSPAAFDSAADRLWNNAGGAQAPRFVDVSQAAGIALPARPALGVVCVDLNGDGWPDFYVANDRKANQLWINNGDGTFKETGLVSGAALNASGLAEASMGIAVLDADADGASDLFVTHYDPESNTFYQNDGAAGFIDVTASLGLGAPSIGYTGWGTGALDIDNDGYQDLFVANGGVLSQAARIGISAWPYQQHDQLFVNGGAGFTVRLLEYGPHTGRGAAFGDVDNDGDVDVLVVNNSGPVSLLLSSGHARHPRLVVSPVDARGHIVEHTVVSLDIAGLPLQRRRVHRDGSYLSASDARLHFATVGASAARLHARWPDGLEENWRFDAMPASLTLVRGSGE